MTDPRPSSPEQSPSDAQQVQVKRWLRSLTRGDGGLTAADLLRFRPTSRTAIDLTAAHPSGLTQLLSGRKTRLSTMLRDKETLAEAMRAGRGIRSRIFDVGQERGIDAGFLATGMAYWRFTGADGQSTPIAAPILLSPIRLTIHPSHNEYEVQIAGPARLNPLLLRHLSQDHGIELDAASIERSAYATARLNPLPVLDAIRHATEGLRDAQVVQQVFVATFVRMVDPLDDPRVTAHHPVIRDLAAPRDPEAGEPRFASPAPPSPDDLHPSEEFLVLDADASQHAVVDRAEAGESFVVSAPPGTGQTQTAVNVAARLAYRGRRVVVVAERRSAVKQFEDTLSELGLGTMTRLVDADADPQDVRRHAIAAVARNERAEKLDLADLQRLVARRRELLAENVRALHDERPQWGVSVHDAMQALAALTSGANAPTTSVRLPEPVLLRLTDRTTPTARLRRFAELGGLSAEMRANPWHGAHMTSSEATLEALSQATHIHGFLGTLAERMEAAAQSAGMRPGRTLEEWREQLRIIESLDASLARFEPDIFDRGVEDLLAATSTGAWRRQHGIQMGTFTRSRLRRVAKELIKKDVFIDDLNEALSLVNEQYDAWKRYAIPGHLPSQTGGVAELSRMVERIHRDATALAVHARGTAFPQRPGQAPIEDIRRETERLVEGRSALSTLPERTHLSDYLLGLGLNPLLDDMGERELTADEVGPELELSWWSSVLEQIIERDPHLTSFDAEALFTLESEYRSADRAHIASGPGRLIEAVGERWRRSVERRRAAGASLRALLLDGEVTVRNLGAEDAELVTHVHPVWLGSVHTLPMILGDDFTADAVIVLDAHALNVAHALGALARAPQVVAFGDPMLPGPRSFTAAASADGSTAEAAHDSASEAPVSLYQALSEVRPTMALEHLYRCVDSTLAARISHEFYGDQVEVLPSGDALAAGLRRVRVEYLAGGVGPQTARTVEIESVQAEVDRCVDLVFDHIRSTPDRSLAIVTASKRHAARVAEAVRVRMAHEPWAASFFRSGSEPFLILPLERAAGHVRDHVVFSIGFGRSSDGRPATSFGPLSEAGGRELFNVAMTRARVALHVLSCFRPSDVEASSLGYGALDLYEFLAAESSPEPRTGQDRESSPLVSDLSRRLRARGARVREHVDGVIDLAVFEQGAAARDAAPVAVISDSTREYQQTGVRERSRLRPERLERFGWAPVPAWSVEVFTDPNAAADRVMAASGSAPAAAPTPIAAEQEQTAEGEENPDSVASAGAAREAPGE
ncbi:DUF4011 domain-containing protein [Falsarthrobacter nasiphocae]|uniref:DUF4011 domain-containing protein n=1 Tax=Falsarthrobacter nasiphocae TaxID=189863 RepID=A0AAE3YG69_9MICC|nr:DUF4011 domain-containing protein [Falsarthrobacter nasiphocae]MDR6892575.1 hypothetical protein [Falsarthrobacter nasiphocae]